MNWIAWVSFGVLAVFVELMQPMGFFLLLIGVAGIVVGALTALGMIVSLEAQLVCCGLVSIALIFSLRSKLGTILGAGKKVGGLDAVGQNVTVTEFIAVGAIGGGELWGTTWRVKNEGPAPLEAGKSYPIATVEGVSLIVR